MRPRPPDPTYVNPSRSPPGGARRLLIAALLALAMAPQAWPQQQPTLEYQVKASYLYNFLHFVNWPPGAFTDNTMLVCVFGKDNFGTALRTLAGETTHGRKIAVKHLTDPEELEGCHVAFVSASERAREPQLLRRLEGRAVLVIGETEGFAERGGTINLIRIADKIRFEINQRAAEKNGLKISSQLLQLGIQR